MRVESKQARPRASHITELGDGATESPAFGLSKLTTRSLKDISTDNIF